jgi:AraC-like DNA-binding protein
VDPLSSIIRSVRLRSSIISRAELVVPFGVSTRGTPGVALFHAVLEGRATLRYRSESFQLEGGDVALLTRGGSHEIVDRAGTPATPIASLPSREVGGVRVVRHGSADGPPTRILCGQFHLDHVAATSFLTLLPEVLVAPRESVGATLGMLDAELARLRAGSAAVLTRLCDVMFVELLRGSVDRADKGWLAALSDPAIAKALALVHADPAAPWDSTTLGAKVGLSRTRLFERFNKLVGESPARYVARWRVNVAADELRRRDASAAELAALVGYGSEEAFARTFKRHIGMSPRSYRRAVALPT